MKEKTEDKDHKRSSRSQSPKQSLLSSILYCLDLLCSKVLPSTVTLTTTSGMNTPKPYARQDSMLNTTTFLNMIRKKRSQFPKSVTILPSHIQQLFPTSTSTMNIYSTAQHTVENSSSITSYSSINIVLSNDIFNDTCKLLSRLWKDIINSTTITISEISNSAILLLQIIISIATNLSSYLLSHCMDNNYNYNGYTYLIELLQESLNSLFPYSSLDALTSIPNSMHEKTSIAKAELLNLSICEFLSKLLLLKLNLEKDEIMLLFERKGNHWYTLEKETIKAREYLYAMLTDYSEELESLWEYNTNKSEEGTVGTKHSIEDNSLEMERMKRLFVSLQSLSIATSDENEDETDDWYRIVMSLGRIIDMYVYPGNGKTDVTKFRRHPIFKPALICLCRVVSIGSITSAIDIASLKRREGSRAALRNLPQLLTLWQSDDMSVVELVTDTILDMQRCHSSVHVGDGEGIEEVNASANDLHMNIMLVFGVPVTPWRYLTPGSSIIPDQTNLFTRSPHGIRLRWFDIWYHTNFEDVSEAAKYPLLCSAASLLVPRHDMATETELLPQQDAVDEALYALRVVFERRAEMSVTFFVVDLVDAVAVSVARHVAILSSFTKQDKEVMVGSIANKSMIACGCGDALRWMCLSSADLLSIANRVAEEVEDRQRQCRDKDHCDENLKYLFVCGMTSALADIVSRIFLVTEGFRNSVLDFNMIMKLLEHLVVHLLQTMIFCKLDVRSNADSNHLNDHRARLLQLLVSLCSELFSILQTKYGNHEEAAAAGTSFNIHLNLSQQSLFYFSAAQIAEAICNVDALVEIFYGSGRNQNAGILNFLAHLKLVNVSSS